MYFLSPPQHNPHTSKPASKNPIIYIKFSIKNAATYQQKSKNPKFFYLFPHKHLQILTIPKNPRFSIKCASSP